MLVIIGLVILLAAVIVGVTGVFANGGSTHALTDNFAVFGYHVTGSTGVLFLYGIVVGAIGLAGLSLLLTGARRSARRGASARRELKATRRTPVFGSRRTPDQYPPNQPVRSDRPGTEAGAVASSNVAGPGTGGQTLPGGQGRPPAGSPAVGTQDGPQAASGGLRRLFKPKSGEPQPADTTRR
ncbi:hypothetical protein [Nocardia sp. CS682]|uniref:hypothetical protein n=1 Tax=Nocardia sp. CS682 TaxID=1047172 RepID=UPI001F0D9CAF|nr:hypothetical protein [Nocardia sp. CS682]